MPNRFIPGEGAPGIHWIGGRVGPKASLDKIKKWKLLTPPGLNSYPLVVQPVPSVYTDCVIRALYNAVYSAESQLTLLADWSWFLTRPIMPSWMWRHVSPKRQLTNYGLHGIISQKIGLFHNHHREKLRSCVVTKTEPQGGVRCSSVGMATKWRRESSRLNSGSRDPSVVHNIQTESGFFQPPVLCEPAAFYTELEASWNYTSSNPYAFMAWCLIKQRSNFIFSWL
jgi:hypothetical protein